MLADEFVALVHSVADGEQLRIADVLTRRLGLAGMAGHPRIRQVVIDTLDARACAEFYRTAFGLDYRDGDEPPPPGEHDPAGADWLVLITAPGHPRLAFQQVEQLPRSTWPENTVPQQLHLDFVVDSVDELLAAHDIVLTAGATLRLDRIQDEEEPLRVYADPSGHPFCIFVLPE